MRSVGTAVLEDTEQLLGCTYERVRLLGEEALVGVDPAPADRHGEDAGRLRGADVERRVADVHGLLRGSTEPLQRQQDRLRVGLVRARVLEPDDDVERVRESRKAVEREVD